MASLSELVQLGKYLSGDAAREKVKNQGTDYNEVVEYQDKKKAVAQKLLQFKALIEKQQAQAREAEAKARVWEDLAPDGQTKDRTTRGDVTQIVDTEKVGGRDANVVSRGDSFLNNENTGGVDLYANSGSKTANILSGLKPSMTASGNLTLKKQSNYQGAAKQYDEARTFSYAKRLADKSIIEGGKRKNEIPADEYNTLVQSHIPAAEKFLYGRALSEPKVAAKPAAAAAASPTAKATTTVPNTPAQEQYTEGMTATNPSNGKRVKFTGGRWLEIK